MCSIQPGGTFAAKTKVMKLSEKIRTLRKNAGLSQEQLGEKINVSRQAITKWESGDGLPDIYNLVALSNLFSITLDELMAQEKAVADKRFLYESHVEYDIDRFCKFDMNLYASADLTIRAYDGEKLQRTGKDQDAAGSRPEPVKAICLHQHAVGQTNGYKADQDRYAVF